MGKHPAYITLAMKGLSKNDTSFALFVVFDTKPSKETSQRKFGPVSLEKLRETRQLVGFVDVDGAAAKRAQSCEFVRRQR